MKISSSLLLGAIAGITFGACKKEDGPAGKNSLINQIAEPAGTNCPAGGLRIISGIDANSNNVLDSNEISKTDYVCNATSIYNKETIINFPIYGLGVSTTSVTGEMDDFATLRNFDLANYPADSISLSAIIGTNSSTTTAFVELFDQTNNKVIANTTISNPGQAVTKSTSINFLKDLPKGPVNLNCRVRISQSSNYDVAYIYSAALRIFKK